jgi:uncharacterized protein with von Willebrand factor type A (vWA) domain
MAETLRNELTSLGIARFCTGQADLVDALLLDVLRAVEEYHNRLASAVEAKFEELRRLENLKRQKVKGRGAAGKSGGWSATEGAETGSEGRPKPAASETGSSTGGSGPSDDVPPLQVLNEADVSALRRQALALSVELGLATDPSKELSRNWDERVRIWAEISEVFGELGALLGRGWDLSRSVLRSTGWLEVVRLRKLLEQLPPLREVVKALGRLQATSGEGEETSVADEVFSPVRRATDEWREVRSPLAPTETRGVQRSDDISRMLPSEAVMLLHPTLRYLWHARRAERALLTYRVEGVLPEKVSIEEEALAGTRVETHARNLDRGPILVCLDTSGSMHGLPENVAKALVLEACRVAHVERRSCHIYSFSGPGDVAERTLSLSPEGLADIVAFLNFSFHGGTDIVGPLERATKKLEEAAWKRADILVVSDGEFSVPDRLLKTLNEARKKLALRTHGVQIGSSDSDEFGKICDHLHAFAGWEALLEGPTAPRGPSPPIPGSP